MGKGGDGAIDLAKKVVDICEKECNLTYIYELNEPIKDKITKIAKKVYHANGVTFEEDTLEKIKKIEEMGYGNLPVCIAKTQYSFSDDPKMLELKDDFKIHVKDVILKSGAGFVVILTGNIFTMPGLPEVPAAEKIGLDENGNIFGIF